MTRGYIDKPLEKLLSAVQMLRSRPEAFHSCDCVTPFHREDVGVLRLQYLGGSYRRSVNAKKR